MGLAVWV